MADRPAPDPPADPPGSVVEEQSRRYLAYGREQVLFTTRIPKDLYFELKVRAIRSTIQILVEHAYLLYLGGRLPPDLLAGADWPEEFPDGPKPVYMNSALRGFSVRLPRVLQRWARTYAVEADISDQELASTVFDWYVRVGIVPPNREDAKWTPQGFLAVPERLIGLKLRRGRSEDLYLALEVLVARHNFYGGSLKGRGPLGVEAFRRRGVRPPLDAWLSNDAQGPSRTEARGRARKKGAGPRGR